MNSYSTYGLRTSGAHGSMRKFISQSAAACLLLSGCALPQATPVAPPVRESAPSPPVFTTKIASFPLGLVVELNDEYLGLTPIELVLPGTSGGKWEGTQLDNYILRCSTPDNTTWEIKRWRGGDRIPTRVLFRPPGAQQRMANAQR